MPAIFPAPKSKPDWPNFTIGKRRSRFETGKGNARFSYYGNTGLNAVLHSLLWWRWIAKTVNPHIKRRTLFLIAILLACIALVGLVLSAHDIPAPAKPVIILSQPYIIPAAKVGWLDRVMPRSRSWGWLWQFRYALFGRAKMINLNTTLIDFSGSDTSRLVDFLPAKPDFAGPDGLRVWRLREAGVRGLKKLLEEKPEQILASPRVTTGDKTECAMYCGSSVPINGIQQRVGLNLHLLPYFRKETIDLTTVFTFSEAATNPPVEVGNFLDPGAVSVHTNFDFAGRFQLPKEMAGIFVLPVAPASTNQKHIGLLLTSNLLHPKK
jgi:hypothetical protein